jgi:hypothetical protein
MTRSNDLPARRRARCTAIVTTSLLSAAAACGDGSKHARAGDTGAAAPATVRDLSAPPNAPYSTAGVSNPPGRPAMAGDTTGARMRDSTRGGSTASPAGARP